MTEGYFIRNCFCHLADKVPDQTSSQMNIWKLAAALLFAITSFATSKEISNIEFTKAHERAVLQYAYLMLDGHKAIKAFAGSCSEALGSQPMSWGELIGATQQQMDIAQKQQNKFFKSLEIEYVNEYRELLQSNRSEHPLLDKLMLEMENEALSCFEFAKSLTYSVWFLNEVHSSGKDTLYFADLSQNQAVMQQGFNDKLQALSKFLKTQKLAQKKSDRFGQQKSREQSQETQLEGFIYYENGIPHSDLRKIAEHCYAQHSNSDDIFACREGYHNRIDAMTKKAQQQQREHENGQTIEALSQYGVDVEAWNRDNPLMPASIFLVMARFETQAGTIRSVGQVIGHQCREFADQIDNAEHGVPIFNGRNYVNPYVALKKLRKNYASLNCQNNIRN
ncbi:MAG: hypothetical protein OIF58_01345 [Cohaesibacter sp.]|nr:hypothetical protein [Cohaesibacter sp.]